MPSVRSLRCASPCATKRVWFLFCHRTFFCSLVFDVSVFFKCVSPSKEIIRDSQGRLDGKDVNNDTPAHYCASGAKNDDRTTFPKALQLLYDVVPESFQTKNLQQQTPESLATKEGNNAQIYFAKLQALLRKKEAEHYADAATRYADAAERFAAKSKQQTEETQALRQAENEMEQKCQDQFLACWELKNADVELPGHDWDT